MITSSDEVKTLDAVSAVGDLFVVSTYNSNQAVKYARQQLRERLGRVVLDHVKITTETGATAVLLQVLRLPDLELGGVLHRQRGGVPSRDAVPSRLRPPKDPKPKQRKVVSSSGRLQNEYRPADSSRATEYRRRFEEAMRRTVGDKFDGR